MCSLIILITIIANLRNTPKLDDQGNHGNRKISGNIHHSNLSSNINAATIETPVTLVTLVTKFVINVSGSSCKVTLSFV
jgi:hypothetical protein